MYSYTIITKNLLRVPTPNQPMCHTEIASLPQRNIILHQSSPAQQRRNADCNISTATQHPSFASSHGFNSRAAGVRIAAENRLNAEMRRQNVDLRRVIGHLAVLESFHGMHKVELLASPPSYSETTSKIVQMGHPTACVGIELSALHSHDSTAQGDKVDNSDGDFHGQWSGDKDGGSNDGHDAEHGLPTFLTNSFMMLQQQRGVSSSSQRRLNIDSCQWVELFCEATSENRSETWVTESVNEIADLDE
jgi:hypothetical protein